MTSASLKAPKARRLAREYQAALHRYLGERSTSSPRSATKLGHQAVALGLETLDVALIHESALLALALPATSPAIRERKVKQAGTLLCAGDSSDRGDASFGPHVQRAFDPGESVS